MSILPLVLTNKSVVLLIQQEAWLNIFASPGFLSTRNSYVAQFWSIGYGRKLLGGTSGKGFPKEPALQAWLFLAVILSDHCLCR